MLILRNCPEPVYVDGACCGIKEKISQMVAEMTNNFLG
jgi:hypothetical protein